MQKRENKWRRHLLSYAKGAVLEMGVEDGVNFRYYPKDVIVTGICSGRRIAEAAAIQAAYYGVRFRMIISPAEEPGFSAGTFDTIVSTFSLSSHESPRQLLQCFRNWCKPGGTILLLEYGLSRYRIIEWLQQKIQPFCYRRTGFHICRNLPELIISSGLQIQKIKTKYAGSVYLFWAGLKNSQNENKI